MEAPLKFFNVPRKFQWLQVKLIKVTLKELYLIKKRHVSAMFLFTAVFLRKAVFFMGEMSSILGHLSGSSIRCGLLLLAFDAK